jgi:hypothetical protein
MTFDIIILVSTMFSEKRIQKAKENTHIMFKEVDKFKEVISRHSHLASPKCLPKCTLVVPLYKAVSILHKNTDDSIHN